jgi:hypothetical protein
MFSWQVKSIRCSQLEEILASSYARIEYRRNLKVIALCVVGYSLIQVLAVDPPRQVSSV